MARPKAGNTQELERLEKEVKEITDMRDVARKDLAKAILDLAAEVKARGELQKSNDIAIERIKFLESGIQVGSTEIQPGYVEIASCPMGLEKPPLLKNKGVLVPRRVDEDGVCYEILPSAMAVKVLNEGSGYKRYLVGPKSLKSVKGFVTVGIFSKEIEFAIHKKRRDVSGQYEFVKFIAAE